LIDASAQDVETVFLALKYPDFHTLRDLATAKANRNRWPSGAEVSFADPEMKPWRDNFIKEMSEDPVKLEKFLVDIGYRNTDEYE
jgi:hypothetical protein